MFDFLKKRKLPKSVQKGIAPSKAFTEKTKTEFLAVFDVTHPSPETRSSGFAMASRIFIAIGAVAALFIGASVYADTANVAADSPLYPLKRLGESVQLSLAPLPQKAELQATFAKRRADEITDLSERKPSSTIISRLTTDLDTDVSVSVTNADRTHLKDGPLKIFCGNVLSALASSSLATDDALHIHGNIIAHFENQCAGNSITASTTVSAVSTIVTTINGKTTVVTSTSGDGSVFNVFHQEIHLNGSN